jgi:serine protease Do
MALVVGIGIGMALRSARPPAPLGSLAPAQAADLTELNRVFTTIARQATPAVVNVNTTSVVQERVPFGFDFGPFGFEGGPSLVIPRQRKSLGSGVIIRPDGYVVTNSHVVQGAQSIEVTLSDGRTFSGRLIAADPASDLAVLRIEATNLPWLQWADSSKLQVGEWVIAVGSPYGLAETVTQGIVSALQHIGTPASELENFIQTDAAINPGNSGGALVNLSAQLVGINSFIFSKTGGYQGIGFAIPSNIAKHVTDALISTGKVVRGWLGLVVETVNPEAARQAGLPKGATLVIAGWYRESPAAQAQFAFGDVVLSYDDRVMTSISELRSAIRASAVGSGHHLRVWRQGNHIDVSVTVAQQPVGPRGERIGGL